MLPRRKERGDTSPKILLNCWVGVVKFPSVLIGWRVGRNVGKLSNVGGEWKSPPEIVG